MVGLIFLIFNFFINKISQANNWSVIYLLKFAFIWKITNMQEI